MVHHVLKSKSNKGFVIYIYIERENKTTQRRSHNVFPVGYCDEEYSKFSFYYELFKTFGSFPNSIRTFLIVGQLFPLIYCPQLFTARASRISNKQFSTKRMKYVARFLLSSCHVANRLGFSSQKLNNNDSKTIDILFSI